MLGFCPLTQLLSQKLCNKTNAVLSSDAASQILPPAKSNQSLGFCFCLLFHKRQGQTLFVLPKEQNPSIKASSGKICHVSHSGDYALRTVFVFYESGYFSIQYDATHTVMLRMT